MSRARVVPDMAMPAPLALAPRVRSESLRRPARKRDEYAARRRRGPPPPPRHNAGRNAPAILAYAPATADAWAPVSLGTLGGCDAECDCTGPNCCEMRRVCTFCGALLFKGEAKRACVRGPFGTVWCGGQLCCSHGKVLLPPVKRDAAIDALWRENRKVLAAHARQFKTRSPWRRQSPRRRLCPATRTTDRASSSSCRTTPRGGPRRLHVPHYFIQNLRSRTRSAVQRPQPAPALALPQWQSIGQSVDSAAWEWRGIFVFSVGRH